MSDFRNQPQTLSDEQQARKLMTLQNNSKLMSLQFASAHAQHENWEQQQKDAAPFLDALHTYDQERPADPSVPKAILYEGLTHDEAFARAKQPGTGFTEANFIPDGGWKPVALPNGETEMEPTYAVINPALQKLTVTPDIAKKLSAVNPQWDDLLKKVGGPAQIPQSMWVSAWHDYSNLQRVNQALTRLNQTLNGDSAQPVDVSSIVRGNKQLIPELGTVVQALAHPANGVGDGENPANVLDVLVKNAPDLLKPLNLTTGQAVDRVNELVAKRQQTLNAAKNVGTPKELADPTVVKGLTDAAAQLPPDQQKTIMPTLKSGNVTKQDADKIQTKIKGFQTSNQADQTRRTLAANQAAKGDDTTVVAFDPSYQNIDGSKGANVVTTKGDAKDKGMQLPYKVDPSVINANVAGFNDVQTKINQLATIANDPTKMSKVQPALAAAMMKHDKGIEVGAFGTKLDTSQINAELYKEDVNAANPETREYVTAMLAAHEAITQLPRLQTFGKSSRMTQQQMEAAQGMLPAPGDDAEMAARKMQSLQTTIDPLRKQLPHMPGAELVPTWLEKSGGKTSAPPQAAPAVNKPLQVYNPRTRQLVTVPPTGAQ
jgi:hypothetical protein